MIDFLTIARQCFQPLAEQGYNFSETQQCRGVVYLHCQRGDVEIRICYEPFGPPWCFLYQNGQFLREIKIEAEFPSSKPLSAIMTWSYPGELLREHEQEVRVYCQKLLQRLMDENFVA